MPASIRSARKTALAAAALGTLLLLGCSGGQDRLAELEFTGASMGTTWNVRLPGPPAGLDAETLRAELGKLLAGIEQSMSTWIPDSDLSRFNASPSTDWVMTSSELCVAIEDAQAISRQTMGAFDVTVGPLVNLWGFGPGEAHARPPEALRIEEIMQSVGFTRLDADCDLPALRKDVPGLYVDLSAYAKGYAVDRAAELLAGQGIANYLVEIGGEVRLGGVNAKNGPWRIAIERPVSTGRVVQSIVSLTDAALATSGDYRNYFEFEGRRYSHTVDPRTGYPVTHDAASVTIIADRAAYADAMATALFVLGPADGLRFAEQRDIAAYFLVRAGETIEARSSTRFASSGYLQ